MRSADAGGRKPSDVGAEDLGGDRRDAAADERDRASDDRDLAGEGRDQAGDNRDQIADHRDEAADVRDQAGGRRDEAADQRDQAAASRDRAAERRDAAAERRDVVMGAADAAATGEASDLPGLIRAAPSEAGHRASASLGVVARSGEARRDAASDREQASEDRRASATDRMESELDRGTAMNDRFMGATGRDQSELDRHTALSDRDSGADERSHAGLDRTTSIADRGASASERHRASMDGLTGVYLRGAGFRELEREMARARRTATSLVVAFIDVDHLKVVNDSLGHAAGDDALVNVAAALRSRLRPYDIIVRYGGDEFVCALSGLSADEATRRLGSVNEVLAALPHAISVTFGIAEASPEDYADALVARADAALYSQRQGRDPATRRG